jgi:hypothetical protein
MASARALVEPVPMAAVLAVLQSAAVLQRAITGMYMVVEAEEQGHHKMEVAKLVAPVLPEKS